MHMTVMPKMADFVHLFVHAVPCRSPPGELERKKSDKENDEVPTHGESVQRYIFQEFAGLTATT